MIAKYGLLIVFLLLYNISYPPGLRAQSLRKMKRQAINRTHLVAVNGDTVQQFTITSRRPTAKLRRLYYWQGDNRILRAQGAYNGKLLDGPYQLTNRQQQLLGSGQFNKGLKNGLWRTWRPDGTLLTARYWRRGRALGRPVAYDENGQRLRRVKAARAAASPVGHWWQLFRWKTHSKQATAQPTPLPMPASSAGAPLPSALPPVAPIKARQRWWQRVSKNKTPKPPKS